MPKWPVALVTFAVYKSKGLQTAGNARNRSWLLVLLPAACCSPNPVLSKETQHTSTNRGITKGSPIRETKWKQASENCGLWLNKAERDHHKQDARFLEAFKRKKELNCQICILISESFPSSSLSH